MDYSQLSERDIDYRVLEDIYGNQAKDKDIMRAWMRGGFKFTTNPADAWPIIVSNQISLMHEESLGKWCAGKTYWVDGCEWQLDNDVMDENPLRAAMIVFLMMQENKNG
ncbi:MAG: phage protein NinX family protein [Leclercia sp.]